MIIQEEVEVNVTSQMISYYEKLGYEIYRYKNYCGRIVVKKGTKIIVKVKDLPNNSHAKVLVKCDNSECKSEPRWVTYQSLKRKDGQYLCLQCANNTIERKEKIRKSHIGLTLSSETKEKLRIANLDKIFTDETRRKIRENNWMNGRTGKDAPNWNNNLTNEERILQKLRNISGISTWKRKVKERDVYVCQSCGYVGKDKDGIMRVHHIDSFSEFENKRTDVNNGVTLCVNCHNLFHKIFGYNTLREHFNDFIKYMKELI